MVTCEVDLNFEGELVGLANCKQINGNDIKFLGVNVLMLTADIVYELLSLY